MSLKSFKTQPIKALGIAECENVPKVMVIAGPNGVGKSTLLDEIRLQKGTVADPGTKFLYQPPHRAIRKTTVQRRWLFGPAFKAFSDLLSGNEVSGYEGLPIHFPSRTPDNVDEAGSTIKYTLGKIENRRQNIYAELVDKAKKENKDVVTKDLPDIFLPIRELTKYLLPHLVFDHIDFEKEDNIKCIWKRKDQLGEIELDIDDLSSGEKSIIILFLPLLENDINTLLQYVSQGKTDQELATAQPDRVFIIDEPELHIHPDLQAKILTYLRSLTVNSNIQFIISTHSPTILDQALDEELYVLNFKSDNPEENQLKKVASNLERLEALKQLAGDAYLVTTGRSIVCIEGDTELSTKPTDLRLFQILYPRSTAFTFIPTGGKGEVIKTVTKLREFLPEQSFKIKIYGLIDMDQATSGNDGIFTLPVCMIENLLLNGRALLTYLQSVGLNTFTNKDEVVKELNAIAISLKDEEMSYRIMRALGSHTVRLRGKDIGQLKTLMGEEISKVQSLLPDDTQTEEKITKINKDVDQIIRGNKALQLFRGKAILGEFYNKYIRGKNISYSEFCYELANEVAKTSDVEKLLNPIFDQMS
jgi:ABC-type branched-subunit amino acid transport system ATPase component